MLVLRILRIWLIKQQEHGLAAHVLPNPVDRTAHLCRRITGEWS